MKVPWLIFLAWCFSASAEDVSRLSSDRAAVERIYYNHRLGVKSAFNLALPPKALEQLVRQDLLKESVLRRVYHFEITPAILDAEVRRIDATTRAPEVLAELKAALDNDPDRFAQTVARPLLVEKELHSRFDNDPEIHAPQRREAERARGELLGARGQSVEKLVSLLRRDHSNALSLTTWQLSPKPPALSPGAETDRKSYFEDLPADLQKVLLVQLRQPGDVSAVIETARDFRLYSMVARTDMALTLAWLTLPKRGYDQWVESLSHEPSL